MKILIGYDGSESADAALNDLKRAGLPRVSESMVVSVGDLVMSSPPLTEVVGQALTSRRVASGLKQAQTHAEHVIKEAKAFASKAEKRVVELFPDWRVHHEVITGAPAWELIAVSNAWNADLVIVGSQGRSAIGRFFLGSVSKRVMTDSGCSVRVARTHSDIGEETRPQRIIIGVDGSIFSEKAIRSVGNRVWQNGTEVRLIAVDDGAIGIKSISQPTPSNKTDGNTDPFSHKRMMRVISMMDWGAEQLKNIGLKTSILIEKGNPKQILVAEARKWNTDSIFVGTRGFNSAFERFRLGSVSTAVAANAHCSVEVVRSSEELL